MGVAVLTFRAFGASRIGAPGPANMALLSNGARYGFRAALPFLAGVVLGKQLLIWPVGFGLIVLAETVTGFTFFASPGTPALQASATIAICFLCIKIVLHPVWAYSGDRIEIFVSGSEAKKYLIWTLASLTVLSVLFVLFLGGNAWN